MPFDALHSPPDERTSDAAPLVSFRHAKSWPLPRAMRRGAATLALSPALAVSRTMYDVARQHWPHHSTPVVSRYLANCVVYRLANMYAGHMANDEALQSTVKIVNLSTVVCDRWTRSTVYIGCAYLSRAHGCVRDKECMLEALNENASRVNTDRPSANSMVVHVCLGDVLDWPFYMEVRKRLGEKGCYYVHP